MRDGDFMDDSIMYDGSGLLSGVDFPMEALEFFRTVGHTAETKPLITAEDILTCIYSELNFTAFFDRHERFAFLCIDSLSHLFTLDSKIFDKTTLSSIRYYAVSLNTPKSDRTVIAHTVLSAFAKGTSDFLVVLFRNNNKCMLSFAKKSNINPIYFSDWFGESDLFDVVLRADIGNLSLKSGSEMFDDFLYMTARSYYVWPLSKDLYHAEWYLLDENDRPAWKDYVTERMNENSRKYGDDYIDILISKDYQTDNIESKDFELDLLALELEIESMDAEDLFELDESYYDDFEDEEELIELNISRINAEEIPAEILDDPVKLLDWLKRNENAAGE